jgi:hypothetical protein
MTVIFKVTQDNSYIGFSILLTLSFMFVVYANNIVEYDDVQFERDMLKTPEGRWKYYNIIYTQ